jgi:hypothetical protein
MAPSRRRARGRGTDSRRCGGGCDRRDPLRHEVEQARDGMGGRLGRHAAGRHRNPGRLGDRVRGRRRHDEHGARGGDRRAGWISYEYDGAPLDPSTVAPPGCSFTADPPARRTSA